MQAIKFQVSFQKQNLPLLALTPQNYQKEFQQFIKKNNLSFQQAQSLKTCIQSSIQEQTRNHKLNNYSLKQALVEQIMPREESKQLEIQPKPENKNSPKNKISQKPYSQIQDIVGYEKIQGDDKMRREEQRQQKEKIFTEKKQRRVTFLENYETKKKGKSKDKSQNKKKIIFSEQGKEFCQRVSNRLHFHQTQNQMNRKRGDINTQQEQSYNKMINYIAEKQKKLIQVSSFQNMSTKTTSSFREKIKSEEAESENFQGKVKQIIFPLKKTHYQKPNIQLRGPYCECKQILKKLERQKNFRQEKQRQIRKRIKQRSLSEKKMEKKSKELQSRFCICCDRKKDFYQNKNEEKLIKKVKAQKQKSRKEIIERKQKKVQNNSIKQKMRSLLTQSFTEFENRRNLI